MTPEHIKNLIDDHDLLKNQNKLIIISTCDNIEYTEVWSTPNSEIPLEADFIYFIKNNSGDYVGAVQIGETDLFWFTKEAYRKKGYAFNALSKYILPHIYFATRKSIKCTFSTPEGKILGLKLGFTAELNSDKGELKKENINSCPKFVLNRPANRNIFRESFRNDINSLIKEIQILRNHFLYADIHPDTEDLTKAISLLQNVL